MSFFSSIQHYVTSSVAGLGLSPRRFSLSRQDSNEQQHTTAVHTSCTSSISTTTSSTSTSSASSSSTTSITTTVTTSTLSATTPGSTGSIERRESNNSQVHGYPKVIPTPGAIAQTPQLQNQGSIRRQSRALECLAPPRKSSFRQRQSPAPTTQSTTHQDRPSLAFCKRRLSWPEVDARSTSGVQETDASYFESFTALAWKRESRRMSAIRSCETRAEVLPDKEIDPVDDEYDRPEHREQLYMDVLYTISNTVGAPAPGGQYAHYKDEMYLQAQRAFGISQERHYRLLNATSEEKPKIIVLTVLIQEADGLEAKDANGYSDPYCMLGIQPAGTNIPSSPQPTLQPRTLSTDIGYDNNIDSQQHIGGGGGGGGGSGGGGDKLRKHHSFRLSFKRKDGNRREQRDSFGGPVPAKFIRATSIKSQTLSPKWNEKFKFDIDDINTDTFHMDIWDHDDESCVLDAVSHLNEVRGVRGLGRYFKQVCQSARQGSQDDFLGCVNIPIADIPSTGLDGWFKLEARSHRSTVQGRIRLKLWLSTREDHGTSEEDDNSCEVRKFERLQVVIMSHELLSHEPTWSWNGELVGPALTILHQMAVQGDLTELQCALARFVAAIHINRTKAIDSKFIHRLLQELDKAWGQPHHESLPKELEQWLAEAMNCFVDKSLQQIRMHRDVFPALHAPSLTRLEFLLRSLGLLSAMKAFRQVCPFNKGVRGEIVAALRRGSITWAQYYLREAQRSSNPLVHFTSILIANLQLGLTYYHSVFDSTNGIQYFSIVYKQLDQLLAEEVQACMETGQVPGTSLCQIAVLEGGKEPADILPFEIYLAIQEFSMLKQHLSIMPQPPEKQLYLQDFHVWFEPAVERWLMVSKVKALQRVRAAISLDQICEGDRIVRHSTSSVDTASCFYQIREFWHMLSWPDSNSLSDYEGQIIDIACSMAMHYSDLVHQALADGGYYEQQGPFRISDEMCITVNNLEYVRRALSEFRSDGNHQLDGADSLLESSLTHLETRTERILNKLAPSMQVPLQKAVFHLAWSPDTLPTNQAVVPLLEYLDVHLSSLNSALLTKNFNRALSLIWSTVINELARQMNTVADSERPTNFHLRLFEALQLLVEFFNADGLGLPMESLHNDSYWRLEQRLQYHKMDTDQLIDMFYIQRAQEQLLATAPSPYGVLTVRAYFNHDSLCVDVLYAKDIIPLDPNGFSDPFVIVELLPRRTFSHCNEQQTNVHKKTLHPNFDECFEFTVSLEQCLTESAMICFTVMDHDVLTANDFAGEAFLTLCNIPGVADYSVNIDNFHGLKQIDLPLMQQTEKNHPILQILESRTGDKQAVEFVRKQKARIAS